MENKKHYDNSVLSMMVDTLREDVDTNSNSIKDLSVNQARIGTQVDLLVKVSFAILGGVVSLVGGLLLTLFK